MINNRNEQSVLVPSHVELAATMPKTLSNYPTFGDFAAKFTPDNWERGGREPVKCVQCGSPTLTDVNIAYGNGSSVKWLMAQLAVFQERLNVPNKMSVIEIETCAQVIHECYYYLKTTELMLFFARLLGGMFSVDWHGYVTPGKLVGVLREQFMPWRSKMLHEIEERERKAKDEADALTPKVTWEEYCKMHGIEGRPSPFDRLNSKK